MLKKFIWIITLTLMGLVTLNATGETTKNEIKNAIRGGVTSTQKLLTVVPINYYKENETLLHYAVQLRQRGVVQLLVESKIQISRKGGKFYGTALQEAIHYGHLGIASYLIKKGSLLNVRNSYGETALHIAAKKGYLGVVEQLVAYGASKNMVNSNGKRPYDLIPKLSWESRRGLERALAVSSEDQPRSRSRSRSKSLNIINHNVHAIGNRNTNIIDRKTKMINSDTGININIHKINKF